MPHKVATAAVTPPDALGVIGRPKMAKMTPDDPTPDTFVSSLLFTAADGVHGKRESAAAEVGKDRSNFTRDLKKLAVLMEGLGPTFLARVGAGLVKEYGGAVETPEQFANRVLDTVQIELNQIRDVVRQLSDGAR